MKKKKTVLEKYEEAQKNKSTVLNLSCEPNLIIPKELGKLLHLKKLDLYNSGIPDIPLSVFQLKNLEYLHLGFNKIEQLPEAIGELTNLNELILAGNQLKHLPESVKKLQKLKILSLNHNPKLDTKSTIEILAPLSHLEELRISFYDNLPAAIGKLTNLSKLFIHADAPLKDSKLPEEIGQLKKLRELSLKNLNLKLLPESIGTIHNLEILDISDNQLTTLPDSLLNLQNLKLLILKENPVAEEPENAEEQYLPEDVIDDVYYGDPILNDYLKQWQTLLPNTEIIIGP